MKDQNAIEAKRKSLNGFCQLVYIFLFCAIFGWIWEEVYCLVKHGFWVERGFLFGPWLPIYGFGGMFIYLIKEKLIKNPVVLFITSVLVAGVVEYGGHYLLEKLFNEKWWDYTGRFLNINGRVHVIGLLFFGIAGCLAAYFVIPPFMKLVGKGNRLAMTVISYVVLSIFMIDVIISCIFHIVK